MKKEEQEVTVAFRIDPAIYQRLKTISLAEKKPVKKLLGDIIIKYVSSIDQSELIEMIMSLSPEERLTRIFEQQAQDNQ